MGCDVYRKAGGVRSDAEQTDVMTQGSEPLRDYMFLYIRLDECKLILSISRKKSVV